MVSPVESELQHDQCGIQVAKAGQPPVLYYVEIGAADVDGTFAFDVVGSLLGL